MEIYEGTIICESQRAFLKVSESQPLFILLIMEADFEITFIFFQERSLIGKKVSIEGKDGYHIEVENHTNCEMALIFTKDSVKEV